MNGRKKGSTINQYKTSKWKRLRKAILARDGYMCQESKRYGRTVPADTVHHIVPAREDLSRFYDPSNLISLSNKEHNAMHDRLTDELTQKGWELRRRHNK